MSKRTLAFALLTALATACGGAPAAEDVEVQNDAITASSTPIWGSPRQGARNTGAGGLGASSASAVWRYQATAAGPGSNVNSAAVIDGSGNVYFGGREGATSLDPRGTVRWKFATVASSVVQQVSLLDDGGVLVSSSDGALYKVKQSDGSRIWGMTTGTRGAATPLVVGRDGTIYFGSQSTAELIALDRTNGAVKWRAKLAGSPTGSPGVRRDGLIYVPTRVAAGGVALQMVDPRRARTVFTWKAPAGTPDFLGGVSIAADGTAYLAGYYGSGVFAVDPSRGANALKWTFKASSPSVSHWAAPVVGPDGTLYIAEGEVLGLGVDKRVVALDPDGRVKWSAALRGNSNVAPALGRNGLLYVMSEKELPGGDAELRLNVFDSATGAPAWNVELPADGVWPSVFVGPTVGHGRVYVAINDGYVNGRQQAGSLHAFGASTLLEDRVDVDPAPVYSMKPATTRFDVTMYAPNFGFAAWLPRGTKVSVDAPPFDVPPRAGFTWVWAGTKEGWVENGAIQLVP
jgi:outer membrane protein assembly factor BamB